jgi:hypothetical protein
MRSNSSSPNLRRRWCELSSASSQSDESDESTIQPHPESRRLEQAVSWCKSVDDSACQNTSHKLSPFEKCTTSHCSSRWWVFCTAKFGQKLMIRTPTQSSCFCVAIFGSFRSFSLRLDSLNCLEFELFATQKARGFSVRQIQTCSVHFHARK